MQVGSWHQLLEWVGVFKPWPLGWERCVCDQPCPCLLYLSVGHWPNLQRGKQQRHRSAWAETPGWASGAVQEGYQARGGCHTLIAPNTATAIKHLTKFLSLCQGPNRTNILPDSWLLGCTSRCTLYFPSLVRAVWTITQVCATNLSHFIAVTEPI